MFLLDCNKKEDFCPLIYYFWIDVLVNRWHRIINSVDIQIPIAFLIEARELAFEKNRLHRHAEGKDRDVLIFLQLDKLISIWLVFDQDPTRSGRLALDRGADDGIAVITDIEKQAE